MTPYYADNFCSIYHGDCRLVLAQLPEQSVQTCVTSPPYFGLRDYGVDGQIGLEPTPEEYVANLIGVFREVRRVLKDDGTLFLNLGDSYANDGKWGGHTGGKHVAALHCSPIGRNKRYTGLKPKDLIGIPWRVAFALQADGWFLRSEIIWAKPNCMPGSQEDRCTSSHETIFMLAKSARYFSDFDAIKTPPRESSLIRTLKNVQQQAGSHRGNGGAKLNGPMKAVGVRADKQHGHSRRHDGFSDRWDLMEKAEQQSVPAMLRDVWIVPTASYAAAHFAVMPPEIARRCILAGSRPGDTVLDCFNGSGTSAKVSRAWGRRYVGVELNAAYIDLTAERLAQGELFSPSEVA